MQSLIGTVHCRKSCTRHSTLASFFALLQLIFHEPNGFVRSTAYDVITPRPAAPLPLNTSISVREDKSSGLASGQRVRHAMNAANSAWFNGITHKALRFVFASLF
jgi:hypothetical protein